jgi:2,4-dienoyl-CoA reductase-like NADH-dependent reductase (Old Yellow Enzyme family)
VSGIFSQQTNKRTDIYSATRDNALYLLHRIVLAIRAVVPKEFVLGIKLNASDYVDDTEDAEQDRALDHVRTIAGWGFVDFIEISGGDYENPGKYCNSIPHNVHPHHRFNIRRVHAACFGRIPSAGALREIFSSGREGAGVVTTPMPTTHPSDRRTA